MPITIKSNLVKIRDNPNSNYTSMDVISDSTTTERISQINNASITAQAQIENKKNTVLNNIPDDYITLTNNVEDFKNDIVVVSNEEPQTEDTKIWINPYVEEMQVPTYAEYNELKNIKVNKPITSPDGRAGQLLRTNGDGSTVWADQGLPTNEQTESAVTTWLNAHPEATTTVQDGSISSEKLQMGVMGFVTPQMFGATGNGIANDYSAFEDCANYANNNNLYIYVPKATYYINGDTTINLRCNVKCDNAVFVVGEKHQGLSHPVFAYIHDNEATTQNVPLSTVLESNNAVQALYANKFFILDTKIAYGTGIAVNAPDDETIKEIIFSNGTKTQVYFTDDVSTYENRIVDVLSISDINEVGYSFSGAYVKQYNESNQGICLLRVNRHNMTVENVQIECNNVLGGGCVVRFENCNAATVKNVKSYSSQPESWGYEIGFVYCSNVLVDNFKGYNAWSSIANRGLKNYTLLNSITTTFDNHWNGYGNFICENCHLYSEAHIGYGKGLFVVKNTFCDNVSVRKDFAQIWCGKIVIEDTETIEGFHLDLNNIAGWTGYDSFFEAIEMPEINITRLKAQQRDIYTRIPDDIYGRITKGKTFVINECNLNKVQSGYSNSVYNVIIKSVPFIIGIRSQIELFGTIVYDDNVRKSGSIQSIDGFSSVGTCNYSKIGGIVTVNFTGILGNDPIAAWTTLFTIPSNYRPTEAVYFVGADDNSTVGFTIATSGKVQNMTELTHTGRRVTGSTIYILHHAY